MVSANNDRVATLRFEKAMARFDSQQSVSPSITILDSPVEVLPPGVNFDNEYHKRDWINRTELHCRVANPRDTRLSRPVNLSRDNFNLPSLDCFELGQFPSKSFLFPADHEYAGLYNMSLMRAAFNQATSARDALICEQCLLDPRCYQSAAKSNRDRLNCFTGSIFCKVLRCFDFRPGTYGYAYECWNRGQKLRYFTVPEFYPDNVESWI